MEEGNEMTLSLNLKFNSNNGSTIDNNLIKTKAELVLDDIVGNKTLSQIDVEFDKNEFEEDKIKELLKSNSSKLCSGYIYGNDVFRVSSLTNADKSKIKDIDQTYAKISVLNKEDNDSGILDINLIDNDKSVGAIVPAALLNNGTYAKNIKGMSEYISKIENKTVNITYKLVGTPKSTAVTVCILKIKEESVPETVIKENPTSIDNLKKEIATKDAVIEELKKQLSSTTNVVSSSKATNDDILALVNDQNQTMNAMIDILSNFLQKFGSIAPVLEDLQASNEQAKQREKMKDLDAIEQKYLNLSPKAILNDKVDRLAKREKDNSVPYQSIVDDVISRRKTIFNSDKGDNKVVKKNKRIMIERNDVE